jgi:hypothetical protein
MPSLVRIAVAALSLGAAATPLAAQQRTGITADLVNDIAEAEKKFVALAEAIPAEKYGWRPERGVRSVGEVFLHITGENYYLPSVGGTPMPASTGLNGADFKTFETFEHRKLTKEQTIAELKASFTHLKKAMLDYPDAKLGESGTLFGFNQTIQRWWISTATHLHEHLGQQIAYARSNGVTPPWSK